CAACLGDDVQTPAHVATAQYVGERVAEPTPPVRSRLGAGPGYVLRVRLEPQVLEADEYYGSRPGCKTLQQSVHDRAGGGRARGLRVASAPGSYSNPRSRTSAMSRSCQNPVNVGMSCVLSDAALSGGGAGSTSFASGRTSYCTTNMRCIACRAIRRRT